MEQSAILGTRVKSRRQALGMTASRLAHVAGVTENAIRKIESGDSTEPRFSTGMRIAQALAVSPMELSGAQIAGAATPELAAVIRTIRSVRPVLEARGVLHLDIFGSIARGNATPTSDVDIIIDPHAETRFSLFTLGGLYEILQQQLGRNVDIVLSETISASNFAEDVKSEAVRVF
jgi:uncharacterized protein